MSSTQPAQPIIARRCRAHLTACLQDLRDIAIIDLGAVGERLSDREVIEWLRRWRK
jgi:hypothetical protein